MLPRPSSSARVLQSSDPLTLFRLPAKALYGAPLLLVLLLLASSCGQQAQRDAEAAQQTLTEAPAPEPELQYGLPVDSFRLLAGAVQRNEFLADILLPHGVDYAAIDRIARDRDIFDVRRMRAGQPYALMLGADSSARHFVYEENKVDYVVWTFAGGDSVQVERGSKPVEIVQRQVAGVIEGSMYQTLIDAGAPALLANRLADIYAWSIDFYRIQAGDRFRVLYTEKLVDGESVGIDSIQAASFRFRGMEFLAFHYDQDSLGSYYDENGHSLQKAFLQAPLNYTRISSRFSRRRFHPVQKRYKAHLGTDYAAPTGTPIRSTGDGVVVAAGYTRGNGNYVKIRHNSVYTTQYLHMSRFASGMRSGKAVRQGEVIGYVGATGLATGPHLCYRFWKNGEQVDPFQEELPPAFPISEEHKAAYQQRIEQLKKRLEAIPYPEAQTAEPQLAAMGG